ncbi:helix-hairpin-helix domain-containing protein [Paenibacillus sp. CC-CFT747]|nr:helix-hairpin-helix domain-containing protein [Paenibacillus sp. CC-CFT747]
MTAPSSAGKEGTKAGAGKINLNTASLQKLMDLPGIGESKAKAIIAYREGNGGFKKPEDITKVKGIGPKTYESFKDRISVEGP